MITSVEKIYPTPLSVFIRLGFLLSFSILDLNLPTNTSIALLSARSKTESFVLVSSIELAISSLVKDTWLFARNTLRIVVSFLDRGQARIDDYEKFKKIYFDALEVHILKFLDNWKKYN